MMGKQKWGLLGSLEKCGRKMGLFIDEVPFLLKTKGKKLLLTLRLVDFHEALYKQLIRAIEYDIFIATQSIMEDIPAGKMTQSTVQIPSPKKVYNPIGSQSQWSFGWQGNDKPVFNRANDSKGFNSYHNQSSIVFGDPKTDWKKEELKQVDVKKKKDPVDNTRPVWNYNPKNAGKTTMVLGDEKPDYRKKDQINKIRTPTTLTNSRKK